MSIKKNKSSIVVVLKENGKALGYLSQRDIDNGLDITLDLQGYTIVAL